MLHYLIRSRARRVMLGLLWLNKRSGSVSDLAGEASLSFRSAHKELNEMLRAGLAVRKQQGNSTLFSARTDHPSARHLLAILKSGPGKADQVAPVADTRTIGWLSSIGAPLLERPDSKGQPPLESVLALGCELAHRDEKVLRIMPISIWKNWDKLEPERLAAESHRLGQKHAMGFLIELAGALAGSKDLARAALPFRDRRRKTAQPFLMGVPRHSKTGGSMDTTASIAERWQFTLSLSTGAFALAFGTVSGDDEI
jgi:hypothetical protein